MGAILAAGQARRRPRRLMSDLAKAAAVGIVGLATLGVLIRPFRWAEAVWAVAGAVVLVACGLLPMADAAAGLGKSLDVCLFLTGMMLLAEVARREGLFDWVAGLAVRHAAGSPRRLFALVYAAGVAITVFLSNDATAVVLTPAVFAAARRAKTDPLPHLFACAFVANAASFVLPIANPANLVLYAGHPPPLGAWLARFGLASVAAIATTFLALRWAERARLGGDCERDTPPSPITRGGWAVLAGLVATIAVVLTVSAANRPLGLPTAIMGVLTASLTLAARRASPIPLLRGVAWSILPLVAGLFVMVEALDRAGLVASIARALQRAAHASPGLAPWLGGGVAAVADNLANNLPVGLVASDAVAHVHPSQTVVDALLIGVDLGPNLSVTGSLATLLWLVTLRREGENVTAWRFLKTGLVVAPPALLLALSARLAMG
jgi:arsenical pump membrane protein